MATGRATRPMLAKTSTSLTTKMMRDWPRKSMLVVLIICMGAYLDAERADLPLAEHPLEEELADEIGSEDVGEETPDQGHREALDRPGTELEEERGRDQGGGVRVQDRDPDALEAVVDRVAHRLAVAQLLADALEDEHVRVDSHTDGEDDAGDPRQGEG